MDENDLTVTNKEEIVAEDAITALPQSDSLLMMRIKDQESKIAQRPKISTWIFCLIIGQNIAVFIVWAVVAWKLNLRDYELLLTGLVAATLGESYLLVKFIVEFTFSDMDETKLKSISK